MGETWKLNPTPAPDCVIIGAGDVMDYGGLRQRIPAGTYLICADGGYRHCQAMGLTPHLLVGDLDSLTAPPQGIEAVTCDAVDKNYTDSALAVEEAKSRGYHSLLLCGMLGGRLDHTLANLQILAWCVRMGLSATLSDGLSDVYPLVADSQPATLRLEPREKHYFSLLSLVERCEDVTITGAKYPLTGYPLSSLESPRAISNEFTETPVDITLSRGALLVTVTPMDH